MTMGTPEVLRSDPGTYYNQEYTEELSRRGIRHTTNPAGNHTLIERHNQIVRKTLNKVIMSNIQEIKEGKAEENKAPENEISERLEKAEMDARPDIDRPTTLRKAFTSARQ